MSNKSDGSSNGKFVIGAALGALAGIAAGILFAPRSGKETRKMVGDKAKEYKKEGTKFVAKEADAAKSAVKDTIEKISNK
ncbi:MAG: YtxH domain-containing protein [Patescibacteria group bacterium]|nr:YtxH domain-containing protein [Patescibacteria group bacterium]